MESTVPQSGARQPRGPHKRKRPALSCGTCRFRKLKCNRATPCEACIKAGDGATCSYESGERQEDDQSSTDVLTSRIDRLESLLLSVVQSNTTQHSSQNPSNDVLQSSDISQSKNNISRSNMTRIEQENGREAVDMDLLGKELGIMTVEPTQTLYHGGQHWISAMFQIQEFRDYLKANTDNLRRVAVENRNASAEDENVSNLLRGTTARLTKEELLSYVPSRGITDMLIEQFFSHICHNIPVIHESTFRREYIDHWNTPKQTDVTWLGLLFSILHHAALSFDGNDEHPFQNYAAEYRRRTIQCLITANYMDPKMYTVEVLILHGFAEWMNSLESSMEVFLLLGIVIRLAMRTGMHCDSRVHDSVTPFQGEMRRRVWATIRTMDIICSFQLSLPATIHYSDSRCTIPRNIFNHEFHKSIRELPPPRALSDATEISYTIIKTRLVLELGKISAFVESEDDPTHEDISKYEQSLEEVKRMVPQHLDISATQNLISVSAALHKQLIDLDRLYQTSKCILYRRSLSQARYDSAKLRYRGLCIDAAMTLLAHQKILYLELNSSYAQNIRKRHIYTLTTHDFFTASMSIALDLHYGFNSEPFAPSQSDISLWGYDRRNEMITVLETFNEFCKTSKDESVEAAHAYGMLSFVVAKARKVQWMIAERQIEGSLIPAGQSATSDMAAPIPEFDTEIFNNPLPDFDWNFWNQFDESYEDLSCTVER